MNAPDSHARAWISCALAALAALALFLITHPYRGIIGDSLIYVTRELARLDPPGLGLDFMFVSDKQTDFTLYSALVRLLLGYLPPGPAAQVLTLFGLLIWFAAAAVFAFALSRLPNSTRLPSCRSAIVVVIFMALFPLTYAPDGTFSAAEPMAIPRPFAEALVMACFAFLLMDRRGIALACLAGAFIVHPLMALAGACVVFVHMVWGDRRWLWLGVAAGLALVAAALAGLPLADKLFVPLDPEWRSLLDTRTRYLFVDLAAAPFWVGQFVSAITILLCARVCKGLARQLLGSTLIAGAIGLAVSYLFADRWASVLIVQLQPWRVLWVVNVIAPAAMAVLALRLWPGKRNDRLVLACLTIAWLARDELIFALPMGLSALALHTETDRWDDRISPLWEAVLWTAVAAVWLLMVGPPLLGLIESVLRAPSGLRLELSYIWTLHPLALPLGALAVACALTPRRIPVVFVGTAALAASALAAVTWDDRPAFQAALESRHAPAELLAALPAGTAPVLWLGGGKETWYWLGRPNWAAAIQGAAVVFSRPAAMLWRDRAAALVVAGLEPPKLLAPWEVGPAWTQSLTGEAFAAVCNRPDAPAAIVAPLSKDDIDPPGARIVTNVIPAFSLRISVQGMDWVRTDRYAVRSCAGMNELESLSLR